MAEMKICNRCLEEKPLLEFHRSQTHGYNRWCIECKRKLEIIKKYGEDVYSKFFELQKGLCAICRRPEWATASQNRRGTPDRLSIDHDHETGKARGLLCRNCNRLLGQAGDSTEWLQAAIDYLIGGESDS